MEIYIHYKDKKREKGILLSSSQSCFVIGTNNFLYVIFNSLDSLKKGILRFSGANILQFRIRDLDIDSTCESFLECTLYGSGCPCNNITYITINKKGV